MRKHASCPRRRQISTSTDLQYHAMENSIYHDHRCPDVKLHATRLQPRFRLPSFLFIKSLWGLPFLSKINYFDGPHIKFMQWSRCAYRARMLLRYVAILIWNIKMILPLFRVMTSMYTVSMIAVMTVSIAYEYDHFAGDSDLDNYSKMGPT